MPDRGVNEFNQLPTPPFRIRQFLCNELCPQQCCTAACPWKLLPTLGCSAALGCKGKGCSCGFVPLHETLDPTHLEAELAQFKNQCLKDPPPPGYVLYAGVGEPVSDSARTYAPEIYKLVCEELRARKLHTAAKY